MSRLYRILPGWFALVLALATVEPLGCFSKKCDLVQSVACPCSDGTCQAKGLGCNNDTPVPTCSDLCQSHGGPTSDAGPLGFCPVDGGLPVDAGLQGPHAFPIVGAWMSPHENTAACGLTNDLLADGGIAAVGIQLYSGLSSAAACAVNSGQDAGVLTGLALNLAVGTPQYLAATQSGDAGPLTQVLTPGVYTLFNEGVSDQTLCTRAPGYDAVLTEFQFDSGNATPLFNGVGTVTIDQFSNGTLVGTLNVWLVSIDGTSDADGGPLTGTFSASFCP